MKKKYIKPTVSCLELNGSVILQATSTQGLNGLKSGTQTSTGSMEADSKAFFDWEDD